MKGIKASEPAPILIPCEGSRCESAGVRTSRFFPSLICSMCGAAVPFSDELLAEDHERLDVVAMIKRGDFG